jgi:hypothetical protein
VCTRHVACSIVRASIADRPIPIACPVARVGAALSCPLYRPMRHNWSIYLQCAYLLGRSPQQPRASSCAWLVVCCCQSAASFFACNSHSESCVTTDATALATAESKHSQALYFTNRNDHVASDRKHRVASNGHTHCVHVPRHTRYHSIPVVRRR